MEEIDRSGRSAQEESHASIACMMFDKGWGATPGWQEVWREHATPDMVGYFHGEPVPNAGIDAFLAFQEALFAGFPALTTTVTGVTVEGDTVIVQSLLEGRQTGSFLGAPASNAEVRVPDVTIFRFEGGRICEVRYFTDLLMVMSTIGAVQTNL